MGNPDILHKIRTGDDEPVCAHRCGSHVETYFVVENPQKEQDSSRKSCPEGAANVSQWVMILASKKMGHSGCGGWDIQLESAFEQSGGKG